MANRRSEFKQPGEKFRSSAASRASRAALQEGIRRQGRDTVLHSRRALAKHVSPLATPVPHAPAPQIPVKLTARELRARINELTQSSTDSGRKKTMDDMTKDRLEALQLFKKLKALKLKAEKQNKKPVFWTGVAPREVKVAVLSADTRDTSSAKSNSNSLARPQPVWHAGFSSISKMVPPSSVAVASSSCSSLRRKGRSVKKSLLNAESFAPSGFVFQGLGGSHHVTARSVKFSHTPASAVTPGTVRRMPTCKTPRHSRAASKPQTDLETDRVSRVNPKFADDEKLVSESVEYKMHPVCVSVKKANNLPKKLVQRANSVVPSAQNKTKLAAVMKHVNSADNFTEVFSSSEVANNDSEALETNAKSSLPIVFDSLNFSGRESLGVTKLPVTPDGTESPTRRSNRQKILASSSGRKKQPNALKAELMCGPLKELSVTSSPTHLKQKARTIKSLTVSCQDERSRLSGRKSSSLGELPAVVDDNLPSKSAADDLHENAIDSKINEENNLYLGNTDKKQLKNELISPCHTPQTGSVSSKKNKSPCCTEDRNSCDLELTQSLLQTGHSPVLRKHSTKIRIQVQSEEEETVSPSPPAAQTKKRHLTPSAVIPKRGHSIDASPVRTGGTRRSSRLVSLCSAHDSGLVTPCRQSQRLVARTPCSRSTRRSLAAHADATWQEQCDATPAAAGKTARRGRRRTYADAVIEERQKASTSGDAFIVESVQCDVISQNESAVQSEQSYTVYSTSPVTEVKALLNKFSAECTPSALKTSQKSPLKSLPSETRDSQNTLISTGSTCNSTSDSKPSSGSAKRRHGCRISWMVRESPFIDTRPRSAKLRKMEADNGHLSPRRMDLSLIGCSPELRRSSSPTLADRLLQPATLSTHATDSPDVWSNISVSASTDTEHANVLQAACSNVQNSSGQEANERETAASSHQPVIVVNAAVEHNPSSSVADGLNTRNNELVAEDKENSTRNCRSKKAARKYEQVENEIPNSQNVEEVPGLQQSQRLPLHAIFARKTLAVDCDKRISLGLFAPGSGNSPVAFSAGDDLMNFDSPKISSGRSRRSRVSQLAAAFENASGSPMSTPSSALRRSTRKSVRLL